MLLRQCTFGKVARALPINLSRDYVASRPAGPGRLLQNPLTTKMCEQKAALLDLLRYIQTECLWSTEWDEELDFAFNFAFLLDDNYRLWTERDILWFEYTTNKFHRLSASSSCATYESAAVAATGIAPVPPHVLHGGGGSHAHSSSFHHPHLHHPNHHVTQQQIPQQQHQHQNVDDWNMNLNLQQHHHRGRDEPLFSGELDNAFLGHLRTIQDIQESSQTTLRR